MDLARWSRPVFACMIFGLATTAHAAVTPEMQRAIRDSTFEVVVKKPADDSVSYEKPLPLDLLPFIERTDAYRSVGTAFALGHNTYVTAAHVIEATIGSQFGPPQLRRSDGTVFPIDRILKFSMHEDFVVFSLRDDPNPAGFAVNRDPKIDEVVLAVGNALGEGIVIRDGLLTSRTAEEQDGRWKWIRFSAAASPGNSGGPLCDAEGRVLGIVIGKSPNENLNYSLPIDRVLDGEEFKARFDQKMLVGLPYMHGTTTYAYRDEFTLPLPWARFVEAFQKLTEQHSDDSRAQLLQTYADTAFPKGPGADELLFEPAEDGVEPRLIVQQPDGTWTASALHYDRTELPADGYVSITNEAGAKLVHLVRSAAASDDAFYADSKAFMDLALKGLNLQRPVGSDHVRVISVGRAQSDSIFADPYGRKWQERTWAVPFMDAYLVGMLLPTPDGYSAILLFTPSGALHEGKQVVRLLATQLDVSYHGTLEQWQAALRRSQLLSDALASVKLDRLPTWRLQTRRFASSVPPDVLSLTDKSPMTLTMGFFRDGPRTVWDVQEIWWYKDDRRDAAMGIWRRARPPSTATLDLRNRFDSIHAHRTPYDGTLSRESAETLTATIVLDVPGKTPGSVSDGLAYGVTLDMVGKPDLLQSAQSIATVAGATRVLEPGIGGDVLTDKPAPSPVDSAFEALEHEALTHRQLVDNVVGPDIRGRLLGDDSEDFIAAMKKDIAALPSGYAAGDSKRLENVEKQRLDWLEAYWAQYPGLTHDRDIWREFLRRNGLPPETPHEPAVKNAESALLSALAGRPDPSWAEFARALHDTYVQERRKLLNQNTKIILDSDWVGRTTPCPAPTNETTGAARPKLGRSTRSLDELWPLQSKRLGEEGTVFARLRINSGGCVTQMVIVGSSGSEMMDSAVLRFFESTEFIPGVADGKAVDSVVTVPVVFKLTK
jgi:serine protease Do